MQISEFLRTLTVEEEDRVLTRTLRGHDLSFPDGAACLIGAATGCFHLSPEEDRSIRINRLYDIPRVMAAIHTGVGYQFNNLCDRFGDDVVGAAIRMRILRNRAQRTLGSVSGAPAVSSSAALGLVESTK